MQACLAPCFPVLIACSHPYSFFDFVQSYIDFCILVLTETSGWRLPVTPLVFRVEEDLGEVDAHLMMNVALCISALLVDVSFLPREVRVKLWWSASSSNFVLAASWCLDEVLSF